MLAAMSESTIPRLRQLRESRGLLQRDIATLMQVHKRTILRWENGEQEPNLGDLRRLAKVFAVSVAYLIGEVDQP